MLSDWVAGLGQKDPGARTAWLSLDEGDNDLTRLLTHLVAAFDTTDADLDVGAGPRVPARGREPALTALVNIGRRRSA